MRLLEGKVALVTGGTSGIGRASAVLFAHEGAKVALTGRQSTEGEAVVAEIKAAGGDAIFIRADLTETAKIPSIIESVVAAYGRLDCAFNNAGISGGGPIETLDEAVWDRVIDTNLKAAFFCLKAEAGQMKRQGGGAIVFNGSVLANIAFPGTSIYSASKGGIASLMRAAAVEFGPHGIRVNCVCPGFVATPMQTRELAWEAELRGVDSDVVRQMWLDDTPLGRLETPEDVAKVVAFLASDDAEFITGEAISVNGGAFMD